MRCPEFEQRLNAVLDDRRSPNADPRLAAHAAECPQCRQILDEHDALLSGISHLAAPTLRRDFARRTLAAARPLSPHVVSNPRSEKLWSAAAPLLAAAAAMLITVSVVWYARLSGWNRFDRTEDAARLIIESPGLAMANRGPSSNATGGDWLIEMPRLPSRLRAYRSAFGELAMAFPDAALRLEEVEHLAAGMRPLRASFAVIWDTLRSTIPTSYGDSQRPSDTPTTHWSLELRRVA